MDHMVVVVDLMDMGATGLAMAMDLDMAMGLLFNHLSLISKIDQKILLSK